MFLFKIIFTFSPGKKNNYELQHCNKLWGKINEKIFNSEHIGSSSNSALRREFLHFNSDFIAVRKLIKRINQLDRKPKK